MGRGVKFLLREVAAGLARFKVQRWKKRRSGEVGEVVPWASRN